VAARVSGCGVCIEGRAACDASERERIRQERVIRYKLDSLSPIEIASP
jgi:hypothetical protein